MSCASGNGSSATISACGTYRYTLDRWWGNDGVSAVFVMLNPSTADADQDDPTIRRCLGFARAWQCDYLTVVNLFALRSTDPAALLAHPDPIGPENDDAIMKAVACADYVVAAWGVHGSIRGRGVAVRQLILKPLRCLGLTKSGHPRHPLYVRADQPLIDYGASP